MIQRRALKTADQVKVTFVLPREQADGTVVVLGDFNDWDGGGLPMRKTGTELKASVTLDTGRRYAFRYRRDDGEWFNDPAADGYEPNVYGGQDCVIDLTNPG
jgi:1,4-alpha-glucan branching enzyme